MKTTALISIVGAVLVLVVLLGILLQPGIRRSSPARHYKVWVVLLVLGVDADIIASGIAAARDQALVAILAGLSAILIGLGGYLEMRKLRREF